MTNIELCISTMKITFQYSAFDGASDYPKRKVAQTNKEQLTNVTLVVRRETLAKI